MEGAAYERARVEGRHRYQSVTNRHWSLGHVLKARRLAERVDHVEQLRVNIRAVPDGRPAIIRVANHLHAAGEVRRRRCDATAGRRDAVQQLLELAPAVQRDGLEWLFDVEDERSEAARHARDALHEHLLPRVVWVLAAGGRRPDARRAAAHPVAPVDRPLEPVITVVVAADDETRQHRVEEPALAKVILDRGERG